jgi:hypothetical protein
MLDERGSTPGVPVDVRRCTVGADPQALVVRCMVSRYPADAGRDAIPTASDRMVQRVRFNGGVLQVNQERR